MRAAVSSLAVVRPRSLAQALRILRDDPAVVPMAGCTDLLVALNAGVVPATRYLDLSPLVDLRGIAVRDGHLRLGALSTWSAIARARAVQARVPMLAAAAREIGAIQIQNRGTIGGNIANASPAGDSLPVLAVAEAVVELHSASGTRRVPFTAFYTGYRTSVRRPDELIVSVDVPPVAGEQWFRKVGTRAAQSIAKVVCAGVRSDHPRLAFGSVAPTVVRVPRTEEALAGGADLATARRILQEEIHPIDDIRSTAAYRRRVAGNLLEQFWRETTAAAS